MDNIFDESINIILGDIAPRGKHKQVIINMLEFVKNYKFNLNDIDMFAEYINIQLKKDFVNCNYVIRYTNKYFVLVFNLTGTKQNIDVNKYINDKSINKVNDFIVITSNNKNDYSLINAPTYLEKIKKSFL